MGDEEAVVVIAWLRDALDVTTCEVLCEKLPPGVMAWLGLTCWLSVAVLLGDPVGESEADWLAEEVRDADGVGC